MLTGTARSERAAQKLLHTLVATAEDRSKHASDATVATVIEQWLATGGPAGEATRQVYAGYIRLHIRPALGDVPLRKLGVADLERWYAALRDKGLAPASIRKAHTIVRAALAQAVRWGWTPMNVAAMARPPLVPRAVIATPKPDSVRRMLSTAREHDPDLAVYLHLAAVTGLMVLARYRAEREALGVEYGIRRSPDAYVFSDRVDGTDCWRPDSTSRRFRKLRLDHGLENVTLYSLRHQAATTMMDDGADAKTVSERLGNSVATVLGTYTRARTGADRHAADRLGRLCADD